MQQNDQDIRELAERGRLIEAIRLFRDRYGVGLKEAKDSVEAMQRGDVVVSPLRTEPRLDAPDSADPRLQEFAFDLGSSGAAPCTGHIDDRNLGQGIDLALQTGRKSEAVQLYQDRYGGTRQEAEAAIAARMAGSGAGIERKSGCTASVLAAIALLCAAASFSGAFLVQW